MREQDPKERARNFSEVALGYTKETALIEAGRCLQCKKPLCVDGCPVSIQIPQFIQLIVDGDFQAAANKVREDNSLPAICGRVCPQETQCEGKCILGKKFEPVAIGRLERFVADYECSIGTCEIPEIAAPTGKKVAVVGSGPSGLTVAGDLAKAGHEVVVYEAFHKPGGVLVYGIPEFRLPKAIVEEEVNYVKSMGVKFEENVLVGKTVGVDELMEEEGFSAVFVGVGAGLPYFKDIPGEELIGVYSANEFLTRVNLMKAYQFPETDTPVIIGKRVAVEGGGNVAMDAARTALRLGAEAVHVVYRRSQEEMPARAEESHHAMEEGIIFDFLSTMTRINGDENGNVTNIECIRMELGEPDASGRRRPVVKEGSEFELEVDMVIIAIGNGANPLLTGSTPDIELNKWGNIIADEETLATTMKGVYAGGDIVTGAATVIEAMGAGRKAAAAINEYLAKQD